MARPNLSEIPLSQLYVANLTLGIELQRFWQQEYLVGVWLYSQCKLVNRFKIREVTMVKYDCIRCLIWQLGEVFPGVYEKIRTARVMFTTAVVKYDKFVEKYSFLTLPI